MPSFDLEPDKFFSQQEWAEIAQSIGLDEIPHGAKQRICDALFEYTTATIKPEALNRLAGLAKRGAAASAGILGERRSDTRNAVDFPDISRCIGATQEVRHGHWLG